MYNVRSFLLYESDSSEVPITLTLLLGQNHGGSTRIYCKDSFFKEVKGSFEDLILGPNSQLKGAQFTLHTTVGDIEGRTNKTSVKIMLRGGKRIVKHPTQSFTVPKPRGVVHYDMSVYII